MRRLAITAVAALSFFIVSVVMAIGANRSPLPAHRRAELLADCTSSTCMNIVLGQTNVRDFPDLMDEFFDPLAAFEIGHLSSGREVWIADSGSTTGRTYISAQTTFTAGSKITSMAFGLSAAKVEEYPTLRDLLLRFNCAPVRFVTNGNKTLLLRCKDVYMLAYLAMSARGVRTIPIFAVTVYELENEAAIQQGIVCKWHGFFALNRCLL